MNIIKINLIRKYRYLLIFIILLLVLCYILYYRKLLATLSRNFGFRIIRSRNWKEWTSWNGFEFFICRTIRWRSGSSIKSSLTSPASRSSCLLVGDLGHCIFESYFYVYIIRFLLLSSYQVIRYKRNTMRKAIGATRPPNAFPGLRNWTACLSWKKRRIPVAINTKILDR